MRFQALRCGPDYACRFEKAGARSDVTRKSVKAVENLRRALPDCSKSERSDFLGLQTSGA